MGLQRASRPGKRAHESSADKWPACRQATAEPTSEWGEERRSKEGKRSAPKARLHALASATRACGHVTAHGVTDGAADDDSDGVGGAGAAVASAGATMARRRRGVAEVAAAPGAARKRMASSIKARSVSSGAWPSRCAEERRKNRSCGNSLLQKSKSSSSAAEGKPSCQLRGNATMRRPGMSAKRLNAAPSEPKVASTSTRCRESGKTVGGVKASLCFMQASRSSSVPFFASHLNIRMLCWTSCSPSSNRALT
mmetsp:Transcript_106617/g.340179  ORF Transcript_106617/g.340179 Transcript_106617/m.340179 type:complete len:253 (+) Transcript_106617:1814-2572(+)